MTVDPSSGEIQFPYSLRLARYHGVAEAIAAFVRTTDASAQKEFKLLDVGVGRGRTLRYLERHGGAGRLRLYGIDKKPKRLDSVYKRRKWRLAQVDIEQGLPFARGAFDIVICEQVLEHLREPAFAVQEMARVARPGALVILGVPSFPPGLAHLRRRALPVAGVMRRRSRSHIQTFSLESFRNLVEAGQLLEIETVRGFRFLSGGPLRPLESSARWYRANRWLGKWFPAWATEIQVLARRRDASRG